MNRRQFVARGATSGSLSLLVGCGGFFESGGVDLEVRNLDSNPHSYEIADERNETPKTSGTLGSDETDSVSNFLPYLDYTHRVDLAITVDESRVREWAVLVEKSVREMAVYINGAESVDVRPESYSSPTPTAR